MPTRYRDGLKAAVEQTGPAEACVMGCDMRYGFALFHNLVASGVRFDRLARLSSLATKTDSLLAANLAGNLSEIALLEQLLRFII